MRQVVQIAFGVLSWVVFAGLWVVLVHEGNATSRAIEDVNTQLGILAVLVLAVTLWWVRHNVRIYRRKGPRRGRPSVEPRTDVDRLGRELVWAFPGQDEGARMTRHVVVERDGEHKTYRRGT